MIRMLASREALLRLAVVTLLALVAIRCPGFVAPQSLARVFNDTAPRLILALGQTVVILTRCIDLSVAANLALTGMVTAMLNAAFPGIPVGALVVPAVWMGALIGLVNGLLIWKLDIPPIVVTLGTMPIFRGLIFVVSGSKWVNSHEMSPAFTVFPRVEIFGLSVPSGIVIAVALNGRGLRGKGRLILRSARAPEMSGQKAAP